MKIKIRISKFVVLNIDNQIFVCLELQQSSKPGKMDLWEKLKYLHDVIPDGIQDEAGHIL